MKRNMYFVATAIIVILFAILVSATSVKAWDENEFSFRGHVEKLEEIDGTKSALFYFNKTDTFLIYSKKSGQWFEISRKDAEDGAVTVSGNNEVVEE
jgi:hypothetical protein